MSDEELLLTSLDSVYNFCMILGVFVLITIALAGGCFAILKNPASPPWALAIANWMWKRLIVIFVAFGVIILITVTLMLFHVTDAPR